MPVFRVMRYGGVVGILTGLLLPTTINHCDCGVDAFGCYLSSLLLSSSEMTMCLFFFSISVVSVVLHLTIVFLSFPLKYFLPIRHNMIFCFGFSLNLVITCICVDPPPKLFWIMKSGRFHGKSKFQSVKFLNFHNF